MSVARCPEIPAIRCERLSRSCRANILSWSCGFWARWPPSQCCRRSDSRRSRSSKLCPGAARLADEAYLDRRSAWPFGACLHLRNRGAGQRYTWGTYYRGRGENARCAGSRCCGCRTNRWSDSAVRWTCHLYGFGVPMRSFDERVVAFRAALDARSFVGGHFWQLAERFWHIARQQRRVEVNIIGAAAAICLDLGFTPAQAASMAVILLTPTLLTNATEAAAQAPAVLRRLPPETSFGTLAHQLA